MTALPVPVDPYLRAVLYEVPARVAAATTSLVFDNHVLANDGASTPNSSTPFTWITPLLARFVQLESLSLVACALTTLDGFPFMPHLARLSVADNPWLNGHLSVVARQCPGLRALDASNTTVESLEEVEVLTALPHLATLSLVTCPVAATLGTSPTYRAAIFAAVPALDVLDGLDRDGRECDDEDDDEEELEDEDEDDVSSSPPLNPGYYASTAGKGLRRAQKGGRSKGPPTAGKGVSRKFFGKGVPMKGGLRVGNGAAHEDDDDEEEEEEEEEEDVWSDHDDDGDRNEPRRVVTIEMDDSEDEHENGNYQHDRRVEEIDDNEDEDDEVESSSFHDDPVPLDPLPPRPTAAMHEVVVLGESDMDEESDYDDEDEDEDSLIGIVEVTRPPHPTHETVDDLDDDEDEDDGYDEDDEPSEWSAAPAPPAAAPAPVVVELQYEDDEVEDEYDDDEESQFDDLPAQPAATATAAPVGVYSDEYDDEDEFEGDAAAPNLAELYGDAFTNGLDASFSHDQLDEDDDAFNLADDEDRDDDGVVPVTGKRAFDLSSDGLADQVYKRARHGP